MPKVEVGQVWKAADKRRGYSIRIEKVGETVAECFNLKTGRLTAVKLGRFSSHSGYRLILDATAKPESPTPLVQQDPIAPPPGAML